MKTHKIFFIFLLLPLFSSQCRKEGENCHRSLIFENNSGKKVYLAIISSAIHNPDNQCLFIDLATLSPNENYDNRTRYCWEDEIEHSNFEFYILDYNESSTRVHFNCDSIQYEPGILKHIILTKDDLDDLRSTRFTISYP